MADSTDPKPVSKDKELLPLLLPFILSERELRDNCYPRPVSGSPGKASLKHKDIYRVSVAEGERECFRCSKRFSVDVDGNYGREEACRFHLNKRPWNYKFGCCQGGISSIGCQTHPYHVHRQNIEGDLDGYVQPGPKSPSHNANEKMYAVDCEMMYTVAGLVLAKVTVLGTDLKVVYEKLVKPQQQIVDYNTKFSGITESDLRDVKTTLEDVQEELLELFSDQTVLVGHSLESDLIALKMIHSRIVDTSVMFPHERGSRYKNSLKSLVEKYLQKTIQENEGGHNSNEDAESCMELVLLKVGPKNTHTKSSASHRLFYR